MEGRKAGRAKQNWGAPLPPIRTFCRSHSRVTQTRTHTLILSLLLKLLIERKHTERILINLRNIHLSYLLSALFPSHSYLVESPHLPTCTLKHMLYQEEPEIANESINAWVEIIKPCQRSLMIQII